MRTRSCPLNSVQFSRLISLLIPWLQTARPFASPPAPPLRRPPPAQAVIALRTSLRPLLVTALPAAAVLATLAAARKAMVKAMGVASRQACFAAPTCRLSHALLFTALPTAAAPSHFTCTQCARLAWCMGWGHVSCCCMCACVLLSRWDSQQPCHAPTRAGTQLAGTQH